MGWTKASDSIRTQMSQIFEQDAGPAGTYYKACMDLDRIDGQARKRLGGGEGCADADRIFGQAGIERWGGGQLTRTGSIGRGTA
jgi:hypothetical protein